MSETPPIEPRPPGGPVRPGVALAFALIAFVALAILGIGMTSLVLDQDVVSVLLPGGQSLGQLPGVLGLALASAAFAGVLWSAVRRRHPSFWGALVVTVAVFLAYLAGWGAGALFASTDVVVAAAVVARVATTWFGAVIAAAAFVCAWGGIALVRTRARRPRWPWEHDDEE